MIDGGGLYFICFIWELLRWQINNLMEQWLPVYISNWQIAVIFLRQTIAENRNGGYTIIMDS